MCTCGVLKLAQMTGPLHPLPLAAASAAHLLRSKPQFCVILQGPHMLPLRNYAPPGHP